MSSEDYNIPAEDYHAITMLSTENVLPSLATEEGLAAFYDDANLKYLGGLGTGRYMREEYRRDPELLRRYAHAIYLEAYSAHRLYLAERENRNTHLPNTVALQESFAKMTGHLQPGQSIVAMRIDIDKFKEVNGTLGYERGTGVLGELGRRIASIVRADKDVLVHLGQTGEADVSNPHGDEYVALMVIDTNPVDKPKLDQDVKPKRSKKQTAHPAELHYGQLARRIEEVASVKDRAQAIKGRLEQEVQTVLGPIADEVNQARVGLNTRDIFFGISIGFAIRIEEEDLETLLRTSNEWLLREKARKQEAELNSLDSEPKALSKLAALALRGIGFNPARYSSDVLGEGEVSVADQIEIIENGIAVLERNLQALRQNQQQPPLE